MPSHFTKPSLEYAPTETNTSAFIPNFPLQWLPAFNYSLVHQGVVSLWLVYVVLFLQPILIG